MYFDIHHHSEVSSWIYIMLSIIIIIGFWTMQVTVRYTEVQIQCSLLL